MHQAPTRPKFNASAHWHAYFFMLQKRRIIDLIQSHHDNHGMNQNNGSGIFPTLDWNFLSSNWLMVEMRSRRWPDSLWLLITFLSSWPLLLSSLSGARSVTSYKSNNKNAVTAILATHGLTVNLSLLVLPATNKILCSKQRNILASKQFLENNSTLLIACSSLVSAKT